MKVSDARHRSSRRALFVAGDERRGGPRRGISPAAPDRANRLENVFQRIGRIPTSDQCGISMSHL
ncbi:hypothetical protein GR157_30695 [Burkholderia sp. 4701]|nr:hypothetical protein [Burkholderia sp. 4701]MXN86197.1 hypothetical protein [Burkholderia sp. 4812]